MSERKLAHIELITEIKEIQNAQNIEIAHVLGWECVVKKGEFKVGDKVVYVEIDSIMPEKPEFEFLRDRKFRVKTIKLRGQVSQGLVLPISTIEKNGLDFGYIGMDVTETIGVTKYLTPSERHEIRQKEMHANKLKKFMMRYSWFRRLFLSRTQKQSFPFWVQKTDEERIQNIPHVLKQFADYDVYVTEKIDYQSGTWTSQEVPKYNGLLGKLLPLKKVLFVVASRNLTTNDKNSLYWKIAKKYDLEKYCKSAPGIIIQGEQGDTNVQGNKYGITEPTMWVFNIIKPNGEFLNYDKMKTFCYMYKLTPVPLLKKCKLSELGSTVQELVEFSKGNSVINPNIPREGIVVRCVKNGQKLLSFKVINPDFLLKYD